MRCLTDDLGNSQYSSSSLWTMGISTISIISIVSIITTLNLMHNHFRNYSQPKIQRPISRILLMVPICSISTILSFAFIHYALYIRFLRDIYEGLVVYNFLKLFLEYLGPNDLERVSILNTKSVYRMPPPACLLTYKPRATLFLTWIRLGVTKILVSLVSICLEFVGLYCNSSMSLEHGHLYATIINNISMGISMFTLLTLYIPIRHDISKSSPVSQFLSIKFVIFFQFWLDFGMNLMIQNQILKPTDFLSIDSQVIMVVNFTVCLEMLGACIWHQYCFSYEKFICVDPEFSVREAMVDSMMYNDLYQDFRLLITAKTNKVGNSDDCEAFLVDAT